MGLQKIRKIVALAVLAIALIVVYRYSALTIAGQIQPVLATWVFLCLGCSMSLWTYWYTKKHSIIGNIGNSVDFVGNWLILIVLITFGQSVRVEPNWFEVMCIAAVIVICIFWRFTNWHVAANLGIQAIMTVAYLPTLYHLWYATSNSEPLTTWTLVWIATVLSFIPAIIDRDIIAAVYNVRRFALISMLIILMIRLT